MSVIAAPGFETGVAAARLRTWALLVILVCVGVIVLGLTGLLVWLGHPSGPASACSLVRPCPPPETPRPIGVTSVWRSNGRTVSVGYDSGLWKVTRRTEDRLELTGAGASLLIRTGKASAQSLLDDEYDELRRLVPDLERDEPWRQVLGASVGYEPGVAAVYCGTLATPEGGSQRISIALLAARVAGTAAAVAVATNGCGDVTPSRSEPLQRSDSLLNTIRWAGR